MFTRPRLAGRWGRGDWQVNGTRGSTAGGGAASWVPRFPHRDLAGAHWESGGSPLFWESLVTSGDFTCQGLSMSPIVRHPFTLAVSPFHRNLFFFVLNF